VSERIRSFIAVDIEDPNLVSKLISIRDAFVSTGAPMKPVEDQNLHITLRFLGEIPATMIDEVYRVMASVKFRRFRIRIAGVGAFPTTTRPRVIWVGVREGAEELARIHAEIERGLRRLGFRPEKEEFVPHITLARIKGSRNIDRVVKLLNQFADVEVGEMVVDRIRLKQSILTRSGPIYRTLREVLAEEGSTS
jgi:2'-5' RNA ligase